jgi:hypothetical protein
VICVWHNRLRRTNVSPSLRIAPPPGCDHMAQHRPYIHERVGRRRPSSTCPILQIHEHF